MTRSRTKCSVLAIRSSGLIVETVDMSFTYHLTTCVAHNGASIVTVVSYAQDPLVIRAMKSPFPPIQWRFIGLSKMTRCLVIYAKDRTRSAGLIAETVVTHSKRLFTASKMINIVLSVLINVFVLKWTARCAWISHVLHMNA